MCATDACVTPQHRSAVMGWTPERWNWVIGTGIIVQHTAVTSLARNWKSRVRRRLRCRASQIACSAI